MPTMPSTVTPSAVEFLRAVAGTDVPLCDQEANWEALIYRATGGLCDFIQIVGEDAAKAELASHEGKSGRFTCGALLLAPIATATQGVLNVVKGTDNTRTRTLFSPRGTGYRGLRALHCPPCGTLKKVLVKMIRTHRRHDDDATSETLGSRDSKRHKSRGPEVKRKSLRRVWRTANRSKTYTITSGSTLLKFIKIMNNVRQTDS
jgi:hypothetical protein